METYTNREIDRMIETVTDKIVEAKDDLSKDIRNYAETDRLAHEAMNKTLTRIEIQTTQHNGRMSKLEKWQSYVIGFCACVTILLLPIMWILLTKIVTLYIR